jgi:hypothetical protein
MVIARSAQITPQLIRHAHGFAAVAGIKESL